MFIMSLAIADLTVGAIVMPISAAYAITGRKKYIFTFNQLDQYIQYGGFKIHVKLPNLYQATL